MRLLFGSGRTCISAYEGFAKRSHCAASMASNPSIERTPKSQLRCLLVAAHVER